MVKILKVKRESCPGEVKIRGSFFSIRIFSVSHKGTKLSL